MRKMIRRPTHPGNIIKEDYLLPLSITIKDMADSLCVSRKTMSKIINERGAITACRDCIKGMEEGKTIPTSHSPPKFIALTRTRRSRSLISSGCCIRN